MKNRANDVRHLGRPVRRVLAVFAFACAVALRLAAGSPPLQAQNWTKLSDPVRPYVVRLTDGNGLSCGLATQEEMASIREAIDRMLRGRTTLWEIRPGPSGGQYIRQLHWFYSRGPGSLSEGCKYLVLSADYVGAD